MTRAKKNPTNHKEQFGYFGRAKVTYDPFLEGWEAYRAEEHHSELFPTHAEALAYALGRVPEWPENDDPDHVFCKREDPHHDCRCHIAPPCSACVECPSWDEERWEE